MSNKIGLVIFLLVLVGLIGGITYMSSQRKTSQQAQQPNLQTTNSLTQSPQQIDTTNQSMQQDAQNIDNTMNSLDRDLKTVDQGLNDQATPLQ
jgi:Flp pilus assembly protein TadG